MKEKSVRVIAMIGICVLVLGLAIGYSALSTNLNITTKTTLKGSTWSIKFANISEANITGSATEVTAPVLTATSIDLDISLLKPGDTISYTFDVVNDGTIDAILSEDPILSGLDSDDINYTLTYSDNTAIKEADTLSNGVTRHLKLTVGFKSSVTEVKNTDTKLSLTATLLYVQK